MKTSILLLAFSALALGSCSSAYKTGQTPDDVYFSPGIDNGNVRVEEDRQQYSEDGYVDVNDRYLRMKSSSKRWSSFDDDFSYWNNPSWNSQMMFNSFYSPYGYNSGYRLGLGYSNYWGNPWTMSLGYNYGWNSWYNPFCPSYYGNPVVIIHSKPVSTNPRAMGPRTYNLNTYNANTGKPSYMDPKPGRNAYNYNTNRGNSGVRVFSNLDQGSSGSASKYRYNNIDNSSRPRGGYSNDRTNTESRNSNPSRSFEPRNNNNSSGSSGTRSSGGSSSSGSAPTRSFGRGGGN